MPEGNKFKRGDWVKCVDGYEDYEPITGHTYQVADCSPRYVYLVGTKNPGGWDIERFDLVSTGPVPPKQQQQQDAVHRPSHYARFKIEPIYFIMENDLPFWAGNVIKYTCRYDAKDGIQDLKKARRYLDMQIKKMEGDKGYSE